MKKLFALSNKNEKYVIGLMSGTSVDGIDSVLVKITGNYTNTKVEELAFENYPFDKNLRAQIFRLFEPETSSSKDICHVNFLLGEAFALAAINIAAKAKINLQDIDLIGSHGQTIYHFPETLSTLQIGEASVIAHKTGVITVSDFRVADMAAGGQGAPLVPYTEFLLYADNTENIALQNIGGVGNITIIPKSARPEDIIAFDTGPGNMIIDYLVQKTTGMTYDKNGTIAKSGTINQQLLTKLMNDAYILQKPPKTTGREYFGKDFCEKLYASATAINISAPDIIATATAFTAETIKYAIQNFSPYKINKLIVGGGGAYNAQLLELIKQGLPNIIVTTQEESGNSSDAKEAIAFAILANETVCANPSNLPSVTGASCPKILGKINLV